MGKMIIEIKCPTLLENFEFRISEKLNVSEGIEKIIEEIREFTGNEKLFEDSARVSLFSGRKNMVLNRNMTFSENDVRSGDTLMILC